MLLADGDRVRVGRVELTAMHTPGHTPEHMTFLVTDTAAAAEPMGALTGDFIFVGDVGRPDLLEKAANVAGTMEASARTLFRSLQRFRDLPDYLQIWPGHGAGSACGKSLGAVPQSTLGYEKVANWALAVTDEEEFVHQLLAGQPEPPKYFAEMKRLNKLGLCIPGRFERPVRLSSAKIAPLLEVGALVVDTRHAAEYAAGHVPGTINIPIGTSFATWAGWLIPYDQPFYLIVSDGSSHGLDEAVRDLAMIGLDQVAGYFGSEVVGAWTTERHELATVPHITPRELARKLAAGEVAVLDVRGRTEWEAGHLPGVQNIPLGYLTDRLNDVTRHTPLVVHCQTGARSAIAASLLRAKGYDNVINLAGGFAKWQAMGYPTETAVVAPEPHGAA
jgi:hydroxyacylglutathione hydrolase